MSLLTMEDMPADEIDRLLDLAEGFVEVLARPVPKVPALQGRTIGMLFYEASTRTRMSFERAAKALSADTMVFSPSGSSVSKGESLKDTALTVGSMGPDLFVVRHTSTGAPWRVAEWTGLPVINAGDGAHQHPTQALLDCLTLREHFGSVDGLRVAIVGDIRHSRVARSTAQSLATLGASVHFVAPRTLLPVDVSGWPVQTTSDFDGLIGDLDVVYMLRIQQERGGGDVFPSIGEYVTRFGLTRSRADRLPAHTMVLHPGPMNRGVEIDPAVADGSRSLVTKQVANGVAVRMAVLFDQLSGSTTS